MSAELSVVTLSGGFWFAQRYVHTSVSGIVAVRESCQMGRSVYAKLRFVRMSFEEWISARGRVVRISRGESPKIPVGRKSSRRGEDQKLGLFWWPWMGVGVGGGAMRCGRPRARRVREKERVREAVRRRRSWMTRSSRRVVVMG